MLAEILQLRRLIQQLIYLDDICQLLVRFEVMARELLLHPVQHLHRSLVLNFGHIRIDGTSALDG